MSVFHVRLFILILFSTIDWHGVTAEGSEAEELITDSKKSFVELVKNHINTIRLVEKNSHRIEVLEKALSDKEINGNPDEKDDVKEPRTYRPVEVRLTVLGQEIECRIVHRWKNVAQWFWVLNRIFIPDSRDKQVNGTGYISITVPKAKLRRSGVGDVNFELVAKVKDTTFSLRFALPTPAFLLVDGVKVPTFTEEIPISTFHVSPSKDIEYTPGEKVVLTIDQIKRNDSEIRWGFYTLNGTTAAFSFQYHYIKMKEEFKSGERVSTLTIDTTSMPSGGIVTIIERIGEPGSHLNDISVVSTQNVHLHLVGTDSPIPYNRVAIESNKYMKTQYLNTNISESPIFCRAIGNPTPTVEFLVEGHAVHWEHVQWAWEYRTICRALVPNNTIYDHVTCRAESGNAAVEMSITLPRV